MIPIARPLLDESEAEAARAVVMSGWLTQGAEVAAFERAFASEVAAPFACAVSSCTAALDLALRAAGVGQGDEVVTVSHSFIAAANAVRNRGATPVFVDIESDTFNLDPNRLAAAITPRTRAILCVHQMGMPCDLGRILGIARDHRLPVIEDAACAAGAEIMIDGAWSKIGRPHGDIACFSFHPRKVITTGEGGMLTTANPEWDASFRAWRQHGMDLAADARHGVASVVFEAYRSIGLNYRMTDIQAAIGRRQLDRLAGIVASRRRLADRYGRRLAGTSVAPPAEPAFARSNWQSYSVRLPDGVDQRGFMQALLDRGIATRRGIMCAHREPSYAGLPHPPLPKSEQAQDRCVLLPLFAQMTDAEQDQVAEAVGEACAP
ncbi:MAG: DegT/DnrJ/EryC1/StrS family aminotransferase [Bauldia sp.]